MESKRIVVVGAGRVGRLVAAAWSASGRAVVVVDREEARLKSLDPAFSGTTVLGDAADAETLTRAGVADAMAVLALTNDDNLNFMIALAARCLHGATRVVARVNDPAKDKLFRDFDVAAVNPTALAAAELIRRLEALPSREPTP